MNERCCAPKTKAWVEGSTRIFTRCKRLSTISTNELCWTGATACRRASRAPVRLCRCREAQGIPGASWVYPRAKDRGARLPQYQRLQRIRRAESARRLEYLGHLRSLAGRADSDRPAETNDHEITNAAADRPNTPRRSRPCADRSGPSARAARSIPLRSEATEVRRCRELRRCAQGALCRSKLGRKGVPGDPEAGIVVPVVLLVPVAVRRARIFRIVVPGTAADDTLPAIPRLPR